MAGAVARVGMLDATVKLSTESKISQQQTDFITGDPQWDQR